MPRKGNMKPERRMFGSIGDQLLQNLQSFLRVALLATPTQRQPELTPCHQIERRNTYSAMQRFDRLCVLAAMEPNKSNVLQHL